jgi:hypothetical protein
MWQADTHTSLAAGERQDRAGRPRSDPDQDPYTPSTAGRGQPLSTRCAHRRVVPVVLAAEHHVAPKIIASDLTAQPQPGSPRPEAGAGHALGVPAHRDEAVRARPGKRAAGAWPEVGLSRARSAGSGSRRSAPRPSGPTARVRGRERLFSRSGSRSRCRPGATRHHSQLGGSGILLHEIPARGDEPAPPSRPGGWTRCARAVGTLPASEYPAAAAGHGQNTHPKCQLAAAPHPSQTTDGAHESG